MTTTYTEIKANIQSDSLAVSSISDLAHVELGVATAVVGPLII